MKELTTEEKAQVLIKAGLFSEDFVLCAEDFIKGAYAGYKNLKQVEGNKENERLKNIILGMANDAGRDFVYHDRKECEQLRNEQLIDAINSDLVTKEDITNAFWEGVKFDL